MDTRRVALDVKIYGSRGSMPLSGKKNARYGGNTACIKMETAGRTVIIDCGSGIAGYHADIAPLLARGQALKLDILVSHLHLDHIIGLPAFSPLYKSGHDIHIYTKSRDDRPLAAQIFGVFKPPYWPVALEEKNRATCVAVSENAPFFLDGEIRVTPFPARHPDGNG